MLFIILLFLFFGKGNKIIYLFSFFLMIIISYYISDPHHLPAFIVEHSIIVQTILCKFLFIISINSMHIKIFTNYISSQIKINWKFSNNYLGSNSLWKYCQNCNYFILSCKWLEISFIINLCRFAKYLYCLSILSL